jgi:hypothetical protein
MLYLIVGIAVGIVIGSIFERVFVPMIDINQELYTYKQTDVATGFSLNTQKQKILFCREYPEANEEQEIQTNAIGFHIPSQEDECSEEDKKIGFIK